MAPRREHHFGNQPYARRKTPVWVTAVFGLFLIPVACTQLNAQQPASVVVAQGNAAVTGFSGALPPIQIAPGVDPNQKTFIDLNGPALRVVDLQHMGGPTQAQLVGAPKPFTFSAARLGQVFGVALDDHSPPNIYAAATSAYGLPIVVPDTGRAATARSIRRGERDVHEWPVGPTRRPGFDLEDRRHDRQSDTVRQCGAGWTSQFGRRARRARFRSRFAIAVRRRSRNRVHSSL